jgi:hypothetical protein
MPLTIPTFSLKDIKNFPYQVIIAFLLITNVYFINRGDGNAESADKRVDKLTAQKDSIAGKYFDVLIELQKQRQSNEIKSQALVARDSLLRNKTEKPAIEIINKEK